MRVDNRAFNQLREIKIVPNVNPYAEGSAEVSFGNTKVLVTATIEREIPSWMREEKSGWITAEYAMLPRSTHTRNRRESASGKQSGRTLEVQRLIGRALRAAIDLSKVEGLTLRLDCDVIVADGGTRTAAITGAWVALAQAIKWAKNSYLINQNTELKQVAAISAGYVRGELMLDLCYEEDSKADFDLNVVINNERKIIEIQGSAERQALSGKQFSELIELTMPALEQIMKIQLESLEKI
ncbi:MAG: ribonuclease PH [Proteobacteria bacterium]|nr:ribonuclease PH [Pseudomonadota bacterium]